jgi:hypothetical protein
VPLSTTLRLVVQPLGPAACGKQGVLISSHPQGIVAALDALDESAGKP